MSGAARIVTSDGEEYVVLCDVEMTGPHRFGPDDGPVWPIPGFFFRLTRPDGEAFPALHMPLLGQRTISLQVVPDARLPAINNPEFATPSGVVTMQGPGVLVVRARGAVTRTAPPAWAYEDPDYREAMAPLRWPERAL